MHEEQVSPPELNKWEIQFDMLDVFATAEMKLAAKDLLRHIDNEERNTVLKEWGANGFASRFNNWFTTESLRPTRGQAGAYSRGELTAHELFDIIRDYPLESEDERRAAA